MACLEMFNNNNNEQHHNGWGGYNNSTNNTMMSSPRISFSSDFIDTQHQIINHERTSPLPGSSDFEFSVTNYNMMAADELFSKGRLLPFKDNNRNANKLTLREELLVDDDNDTGRTFSSSSKPPKGSSSRWKELLGLKKNHIASKKGDKQSGNEGSVSKFHEEVHVSKTSQLRDAGSSSRDVEIGM